jgi:hypothetical protein
MGWIDGERIEAFAAGVTSRSLPSSPVKQIILMAAAVAALGLVQAPSAGADTYCGQAGSGASVYAGNSDTSCEFAMDTAEAYRNYGNGSQPFSVYSPVTGQTYTMTCTSAGSVCQGGNNAVVYLRR